MLSAPFRRCFWDGGVDVLAVTPEEKGGALGAKVQDQNGGIETTAIYSVQDRL